MVSLLISLLEKISTSFDRMAILFLKDAKKKKVENNKLTNINVYFNITYKQKYKQIYICVYIHSIALLGLCHMVIQW